MKNLLFHFQDLSDKDKAVKAAVRAFTRAGQTVVQTAVDPKVKRSSGISYREMALTFGDGQTVSVRIKQTGDVYQVLLNGKLVPIKNQDDHQAAVNEIAKLLDAGRSKFQAALAKAAAKLPPSIKTAAPKLEAVLKQKIEDLNVAIEAAREELATLQTAA
jgi:hypothetical protein